MIKLLLLTLVGLIVGLGCITLGLWGLVIGRTVSAYHFNKGTIARESRARFYGLVWIILGGIILLLVVVRGHELTRGGISFTPPPGMVSAE